MNQDRQVFLAQQGAQVHEGVVQNFGDFSAELLATRDGTVLCDLSQFATILVSGEEAQKFLQNLLSNDVNAVNATTAQLSSFNSAKGRMLATFLVWQQGGDYLLQLPQNMVQAMHKKLSMYVMRSKVTVSIVSDEIVSLGLCGSAAAALLQQHLNITLEQDWGVEHREQTSVIRLSAQRYQIFTTPAQAITLWETLAKSAKPVGSACWDWLNIRAGMPVVTPATQEKFVLQMANLDILGGVSFKKGCYPGQEIVARTHYLGKQKRRMFLAHIETNTAPGAGNELFSEEVPDQPCGVIMNACAAPGGGYDLLAVMQISSQETQHTHLLSPQGPELEFMPLPYAFPEN